MPKKIKENIFYKKFELKHIYPEYLKSHFVANLVIQHQPEFFILSFFETWPPPILGETEAEKKDAIEKIDHVEAKCVSRLVITPEKMREFIRTMIENLKKYDEMMERKSK